jgi:hypothetical protein
LTWTKHNNHLNEVGRVGHFEQLSTELMWRFVFHATAIGWCVAVGIAYWISNRRREEAVGVSINDTLARAYARNPLAFAGPEQVATLRSGALSFLRRGISAVSSAKTFDSSGVARVSIWYPIKWLNAGGPPRWIASVGIAGFVIQLLVYVIFVRPTV